MIDLVRMHCIQTIIVLVCELVLFFLLCWIISKIAKKKYLKTVVVVWVIIFLINCLSVIINIPLIIGFNVGMSLDGGTNGKYVSLGYAIRVEGYEISPVSTGRENVYFTGLFGD